MERDEIAMIVAHNIEAAIARKGLNPAELARRAKLNPTGVYDILKGKSQHPRLDTIRKIAAGLGVPMSSLFIEPSEDQIDQDLNDAVGLLPTGERKRLLQIARALLPSDEAVPALPKPEDHASD